MSRPKIVYGNGVNLAGLWSKTPMRLRWNDNLKEWYDSNGCFSVEKLGTQSDEDIITYASTNRNDVVTWIKGVQATMRILHEWSEE